MQLLVHDLGVGTFPDHKHPPTQASPVEKTIVITFFEYLLDEKSHLSSVSGDLATESRLISNLITSTVTLTTRFVLEPSIHSVQIKFRLVIIAWTRRFLERRITAYVGQRRSASLEGTDDRQADRWHR